MRKIKVLSFCILVCFFTAAILRCYTLFGEVDDVLMNVQNLRSHPSHTNLKTECIDGHLFIDLKTNGLAEETLQWNNYSELSGDSVLIYPTSAHIFMPRNGRPLTTLEKVYEKLDVPVLCISVALYVFILILFCIVIFSFIRTKVFDHRNVKYMRLIGVSLITVVVLTTALRCLDLYVSSQGFTLNGFDIAYRNVFEWTPLISGLIVLLMCEILRKATDFKQEQDLTI
ncbi:MAG: DUF2975 domain-containing protein [Bacteroidales bacterium]|nr:DUF2975 domain-containing protein [Bacteroidales bacterium]